MELENANTAIGPETVDEFGTFRIVGPQSKLPGGASDRFVAPIAGGVRKRIVDVDDQISSSDVGQNDDVGAAVNLFKASSVRFRSVISRMVPTIRIDLAWSASSISPLP